MSQLLFILAMFAGFLVPAALFGQWWLFTVFMVFGCCFGAIEIIAKIKTGKTVSQQFWTFSKEHPAKAWIILGGMLIAWIALLIHLGSKMIGA